MKIAFLGLALYAGCAFSGVLYQWEDASGQTRFGYRPPLGVQARLADEKNLTPEATAACKAQMQAQLQLVDQEIARLRKEPAGLGPEYEFTAEGKQRLINDLLAHRSALVTGRTASDFAPADRQQELQRLKAQYEHEQAALRQNLSDQEQQARRLRRERRGPVNTLLYGIYPRLRY
jgi:hypothetical protein